MTQKKTFPISADRQTPIDQVSFEHTSYNSLMHIVRFFIIQQPKATIRPSHTEGSVSVESSDIFQIVKAAVIIGILIALVVFRRKNKDK